jgi:hypothetical protein
VDRLKGSLPTCPPGSTTTSDSDCWVPHETTRGPAGPSTFFALVGVSIATGLVVALGALEEVFASSLTTFKSAQWAVAALIAVVAYSGRVQAINDLNSIFHIDASALPMTLTAGTVLNVAALLFWFFVALAVAGVISLVLMYGGAVFDEKTEEVKKLRAVSVAFAVVISCGVSAGFAYVHLKENFRQQKLYRLAHMTDFSGSFRCEGIDAEASSVLFIGPEQRRVLVAPKLPTDQIQDERQPQLLQQVAIPSEFEVRDCVAPPPKQ